MHDRSCILNLLGDSLLRPRTLQNEMITRNKALEILGLTLKQDDLDWLLARWDGDLKWYGGKTGYCKGYSPELIERLKIERGIS